ncbi:MAG: hypothetical protein Q7R49_02015 [Candidatus Daviesbacteria bacterium]|nr:hypothetical protein [Candidatus Daviesbacteria bacterium]
MSSSLLERLSAQTKPAQEVQLALPIFADIPTQPTQELTDITWALHALLNYNSQALSLISKSFKESHGYSPRRRFMTRVNLQSYNIPTETMAIYSHPKNQGIEVVMRLSEKMNSEKLKISLGRSNAIASQIGRSWRLLNAEDVELLRLGVELFHSDDTEAA